MGQELAEITSRRICCCVVTHWLLHRDASEAASWCNFGNIGKRSRLRWWNHVLHCASSYVSLSRYIRLRWFKDPTALAWRYDFVVSKIRIRKQNETDLLAEWSGWVSWQKWLNELTEVAELAAWSGWSSEKRGHVIPLMTHPLYYSYSIIVSIF